MRSQQTINRQAIKKGYDILVPHIIKLYFINTDFQKTKKHS